MISIRINEDEKNILNLESDLGGITLNALIGKVISRHVRWDRFSREMDNVSINKKTLAHLLNNCESTNFQTLCATNPIISMKDAILFSKGEVTLENFMSVLDMWLDSSNISYRHISEEGFDKYIIKHDLGNNFSIFIESLITKGLQDFDILLSNMISETNHVSFEIIKKKDV